MGGRATAWPAAPASLSNHDERPRACRDACASSGRVAARAATARAAGCVIGALLFLALLALAATFALPAVVRSLRRRRDSTSDRAKALLVLAARGLPPDRTEWARAMLAELDHVEGRRERWRFSFGCAWAAVRIRTKSPEPGGALLRAVVLGGAAIAVALVGYGLVHYPGLRSERNVWEAMVAFLATLLIYTALVMILSRGTRQRSVDARRYGLMGGPRGGSRLALWHRAAIRSQGMGLSTAPDRDPRSGGRRNHRGAPYCRFARPAPSRHSGAVWWQA